MSTSLTRSLRFRISFVVIWFLWVQVHLVSVMRAGYPFLTALLDSLVSNTLLSGAVLVVTLLLGFYNPQRRRVEFLLGLCLVLTVAWYFLSRIFLGWLSPGSGYLFFLSQTSLIRCAFGFLITGCAALLSVLWYLQDERQQAERRQAEAMALAREAELFRLRQQLQPHFLFNSLNSINALIGFQPEKARTMIQQLSDFLRGTLRKDEKSWTSFEEELQHLNLYLDIEKVRFGHRLQTAVTSTAPPAARIPHMLLQPVMENAIKFGLYDTTAPLVISLQAECSGNLLVVTVRNPFDPETAPQNKGTGFGLSAVRRRLYLLFARHDLLETAVHEQTFTTILKIPQ